MSSIHHSLQITSLEEGRTPRRLIIERVDDQITFAYHWNDKLYPNTEWSCSIDSLVEFLTLTGALSR